MNFLFKILLTFNATFWMIVVYGIKERWCIFGISSIIFSILMICVPLILSLVSLALTCRFGKDTLTQCVEFSLADNDFFPVYLVYFFVSLSINDNMTMGFLYCIVYVFTFLSQTQYFNPILLLFGYHYYHVWSAAGTKIFVIIKGKVIRNKEDLSLIEVVRLNDTTFIQKRKRK